MTALDPTSEHPASNGPAAGWYDDPGAPTGTRLRWWNGAGWSEHTRAVVAAPPAPVAPAPTAPAPMPPRSTAVVQRTMHNGTAWWSFGLGVFALLIASTVLMAHRSSILISSSGAIAILSGIRALRLRSLGFATALVPAVLGIAFGALGTVVMLALFLAVAR